jgi:NADH-quinone oxidoreductase subunit H
MSTAETILRVFFAALIYPGFLFVLIIGLLAESLRRKFAARAEGREGPPWLQPIYDLRKYFGRTALVPGPALPKIYPTTEEVTQTNNRAEMSRSLLYFSPAGGLLAMVLAAALLPLPGNLWPFAAQPFGVELLAIVLLLEIPAVVCLILGSVGGSVYSQLAGSRIAQTMTVYAAPYLVAVFGPALALQTLDAAKIAAADSQGMIIVKIICGLIYLVCLPARLRLRPLAVAPGEGLEGVTTDLNGPPLALYKLMEMIERVVSALLFAALLVPFGGTNPGVFIGGVLLALGVIGAVDVLFSQIRLREALRFYFIYGGVTALLWFLVLSFLVKI